jgi:hypothetical protein
MAPLRRIRRVIGRPDEAHDLCCRGGPVDPSAVRRPRAEVAAQATVLIDSRDVFRVDRRLLHEAHEQGYPHTHALSGDRETGVFIRDLEGLFIGDRARVDARVHPVHGRRVCSFAAVDRPARGVQPCILRQRPRVQVEAANPWHLEHRRMNDEERVDIDQQIDFFGLQLVTELRMPNELGRLGPKPERLRRLVDERASRRACRRRRQHEDDLGRLRNCEEPADDLDARRLLGGNDDPKPSHLSDASIGVSRR